MNFVTRIRRWFAYRFQTTVAPGRFNRHRAAILTSEEWEAQGGWDGALVPGWYVERPNWWRWDGGRSGVTDSTVEEARRRLDEWQESMARREAKR